MRSIIFMLTLGLFTFFSSIVVAAPNGDEGKQAFELICKSCHADPGKNHSLVDKDKKRQAPPMAAVKKHYLRAYPQQEDFANAIATWVSDPREDKALLIHAVGNHGVMLGKKTDETTLKKIGAYIYQADLGKPGCYMHGKKHGKSCGDKSTKKGHCSASEKSCCKGKEDCTHKHDCDSHKDGHGPHCSEKHHKEGAHSTSHGEKKCTSKGECCSGDHPHGMKEHKEKGTCPHHQ